MCLGQILDPYCLPSQVSMWKTDDHLLYSTYLELCALAYAPDWNRAHRRLHYSRLGVYREYCRSGGPILIASHRSGYWTQPQSGPIFFFREIHQAGFGANLHYAISRAGNAERIQHSLPLPYPRRRGGRELGRVLYRRGRQYLWHMVSNWRGGGCVPVAGCGLGVRDKDSWKETVASEPGRRQAEQKGMKRKTSGRLRSEQRKFKVNHAPAYP